MDNHPIPQDITGFQFRLIGNMTVKQFIYLAAGTIVAWLFFFVLPLPVFIKWPVAIISIGLGGGIAFIPIDGRPMDQMFINLIKAILAPTQYVYDRTGGIISPLPVRNAPQTPTIQTQVQSQQTQEPAVSLMDTPVAPAIQAQQMPPQQIVPQPADDVPPQTHQPSEPPIIAPDTTAGSSLGWQIEEDKDKKEYVKENNELVKNEIALETEVDDLKKKLDEVKTENSLNLESNDSNQIGQKVDELNKMLEQTLAQKAELEKELALIKANAAPAAAQPQAFTPATATIAPQTVNVRQVPKPLEKAVGVIAASQDPNVIIGIVKDPRGNPLQNILVEVKDPEDNPVRAFKTNALGKFASATPLSNGKYIITFEDTKGQNKFDPVQIEATGNILMPLEVFSVDGREELRRELFN